MENLKDRTAQGTIKGNCLTEKCICCNDVGMRFLFRKRASYFVVLSVGLVNTVDMPSTRGGSLLILRLISNGI
jgi:hypothetical protein